MINPGTGSAWLRSHAYSEDGIMITDYSHMMEKHRFFSVEQGMYPPDSPRPTPNSHL